MLKPHHGSGANVSRSKLCFGALVRIGRQSHPSDVEFLYHNIKTRSLRGDKDLIHFNVMTVKLHRSDAVLTVGFPPHCVGSQIK
jgi:hypothetical protein